MDDVARSESETFAAIKEVTGELHRAQSSEARSIERLGVMAQEVSAIGDPEERLRAASWLYWMVPELPAKDSALGALGAQASVPALLKAIDGIFFPVGCDACSKSLRFKHRTEVKKARTSVRRLTGQDALLCTSCYSKLSSIAHDRMEAERREEQARWDRQREQRIEAMKRKGLRSFLDSPGWYYLRRDFLADRHVSYPGSPPEESGYVCDGEGCLEEVSEQDVYFKTFRQWWLMRATDITALCERCHGSTVAAGGMPDAEDAPHP